MRAYTLKDLREVIEDLPDKTPLKITATDSHWGPVMHNVVSIAILHPEPDDPQMVTFVADN